MQRSILDIIHKQLELTFRNHVFSFFYFTQYALPYLKKGASINNTMSVTAYQRNKDLIDYSAIKGAIVASTRSRSLALVEQRIRVNGIVLGSIGTPLIRASCLAEEVASFGKKLSYVPMNSI